MRKNSGRKQDPVTEPLAEGMRLTRVPIDKLNMAPYNPRKELKPGDKAYDALKKSMAKFGDVEPVVWNKRSGNVVGGHQRLKIKINEFKATHADVIVVDLGEKEEVALNLALNKIKGDWDIKKLKTVLGGLLDDELDFDFDVTGFDQSEFSEIEAMGSFFDQAEEMKSDYEANPPKDAMAERKEIEKRKAIVRLPLFVDDLVRFEKIMKMTNEQSRAKAFMTIMDVFEKVTATDGGTLSDEGELKWD